MIYNTEMLRETNTLTLKNTLKNLEFGTKTSLAKLTGLSVATCSNILGDLLKSGEVFELDLGEPKGGRPSRRFKYNFNFSLILNMYLRKENNEDYIFYRVNNLADELIEESSQNFLNLNLRDIHHLIERITNNHLSIKTLTISIPGVIHNGYIDTCDILTLEKINLKEFLSENFSLKIRIENDVNVLAYGSLSIGKTDMDNSSVYLYFPDLGDPGMGIIINGKVILGNKNFAGEIKHLPIQPKNLSAQMIQSDKSVYTEYIYNIVKTVNAIINPGIITISCTNMNEEFELNLLKKLKMIKKIGQISFEKDIHDSLLLGLNYLSKIMTNEV